MADTEHVSVAFPADQIALLHQAVASGEYDSTEDILREALEEWQQRRDLTAADFSRLRDMWAQGKESGEPIAVDLPRLLQTTREHLARRA